MINILQQIDQQKQELENLRPIKPEYLAKIREKFKLEYNFYSNNLEGNTLTLGETRSLILDPYNSIINKKRKDVEEMKSHIEVYREVGFLQDKILTKDKKPVELSQNLIKNLHKQIFVEDEKRSREENGITKYYTIPAGNYKLEQNHVITPTGEKFYYSEPEMVPQMMSDLVDWYNKKRLELHPVVLAAIFHYKFIRIHPFGDGNGRMARFLMNMILQSGDYSLAVVKSDDKSKEKYLQSLQKTDQNFFDIQTCLESDQIELFEAFITEVSELVLHSTDLMIRGAKCEDITETKDLLRLFEMELNTRKDKILENRFWLTRAQKFKDFLEMNIISPLNQIEEFCFIVARENFGQMVSETWFDTDKKIKLSKIEKSKVWVENENRLALTSFTSKGEYKKKSYPECFVGNYKNGVSSKNNWKDLLNWYEVETLRWEKIKYLTIKYAFEGYLFNSEIDNWELIIGFQFEKLNWSIGLDFNDKRIIKTYKYGEFISENDIKEFIAFLIKTSKEFL
jgi:Fic family protein